MVEEVRLLTLWQPWASLVALKLKGYETRSWGTSYRGKVAIHAAKRVPKVEMLVFWEALKLADANLDEFTAVTHPFGGAPHAHPLHPYNTCGKIVAIADLSHCLYMVANDGDPPPKSGQDTILIPTMTPLEKACGDWQPGRYAWRFGNVTALPEPIPYKGSQGLRWVQDEQVLSQLREVA